MQIFIRLYLLPFWNENFYICLRKITRSTKNQPDKHKVSITNSLIMNTKNLLIIEDDKINAFILKKFLSDHYNAEIASSPESAIDKLKNQDNSYNVILMDINLGDDIMDGTDLLNELRTISKYESTSFIATTAYAMSGDREKFLEEGFNDYIFKPIQKTELHELLNKYI